MESFLILVFLPLILAQSNCTLPNLSIGDFNVTSEQQFKAITNQQNTFLIAISAKWCNHCCHVEPVYSEVVKILDTLEPKIKLGRVDLAKVSFIKKHILGTDQLPLLYAVKKGKFYAYHDIFESENIVSFVDKIYKPLVILDSEDEIDRFWSAPKDSAQNYLRVIAFLYESEESEDSLIEQYEKASLNLANWVIAKFGLVTNKRLIKKLREKGDIVKYLNCIVLKKKDADYQTLDLEISQDIESWITKSGVSLVDELTGYNFQIYKELRFPMLAMFLDKNNLNQDYYLSMFTKVARDFEHSIKFVWMDGNDPVIMQRKRKLGLITKILPSLAYNLLDDRIIPYPESQPITENGIRSFVVDFLDNKLKSVSKISDNKPSLDFEKKYSETPIVYMENFEEKVLQEGVDVVLLIYSSFESEDSYNMAPYYNKLAKRFTELNYPSLKVYRLDIATDAVPKMIKIDHIPSIYMFPAFHKNPPYIHYTGINKVPPMMFFVQKYADIKFELPILPHLSPDQIDPYYTQKAELPLERQEKVAAANERREWDL